MIGRRLPGALLIAALAAPSVVGALEIPPPPPRFVHDAAGLLPAPERRALEERVLEIDRAGTAQIAVAIFRSLEGESLEDFTIRLVESWKPGHGDRDDGVLLAVFLEERKIRIEVGYGLEDRITDARASRIIRRVIAPAFRRRAFGAGLIGAVDAIAALAEGGEPPAVASSPPSAGLAIGFAFLVLAMLVMFILVGLLANRAARRARQMTAAGRQGEELPWWVWLLLSGSQGGRGGGRSSHGGGFFGGGGGFGGGSSFGGGSFGGGGASGGW